MARPRSGGNALYVVASNCPARLRSGGDFYCDGVADDVQIQAALNIAAVSPFAVVLLSPGTFYTSASINVPAGVVLTGSGMYRTTIQNASNTRHNLLVLPDNLYSSGTATAGGSSTLTDAGKSWTTNALANRYVIIIHGTGVGQWRLIASNTATQITVSTPWTVEPDNTSQYVVGPGSSQYPIDIRDMSLTVSGTPTAGTATAATADTLTDSGKSWTSNLYVGCAIYIYAGTGLGQFRIVESNTGNTVTVTRPWHTTPDTTSQYVIGGAPVLAHGLYCVRTSFRDIMTQAGQCPHFLVEASQEVRFIGCRTLAGSYGGAVIIEACVYRQISGGSTIPALVAQCTLTTPRGGCVQAGRYAPPIRICDNVLSPTDERGIGVDLRGGTGHIVAGNVIHSSDTTTAVVSGTATAGGSNTLTDAGKSWATNAHVGRVVQLTGGTGAGQRRLITANTSTQLTVELNWTTPPDSTTTYEIVRRSLAGVRVTGANAVTITGNTIFGKTDGLYACIWNVDGSAVSATGNVLIAPSGYCRAIIDDVSGITSAGNVTVTS